MRLPKEIIHQILFYYTNTYQGLLQCRGLSLDWKDAVETSFLWLLCDLTFYCPKEYLLLRKKQYKIINDFFIFIEWSAFIGNSVHRIHLLQPVIQYQECIKVTCEGHHPLLSSQQQQQLRQQQQQEGYETYAKEISIWYLQVMVGYYQWWNRCIYYRKVVDYYYDSLDKRYLTYFLPYLLGISCFCFAGAIYGLNDLEMNLQQRWVVSDWNQWGFRWSYGYCLILLILALMKEFWKYLHELEYRRYLISARSSLMNGGLSEAAEPFSNTMMPVLSIMFPSTVEVFQSSLTTIPIVPPIEAVPAQPTAFNIISTSIVHNSLSILYLSNKGYDEMMIGLFMSLFAGVFYMQYKIQQDLNSVRLESVPSLLSEEEGVQIGFKFSLLWSYSMIPFWLWMSISAVIMFSRNKELTLTPALLILIAVITFIATLCTIILLYLDNILSAWWYQSSLSCIAISNIFFTILVIGMMNYFLALCHEIRYYPIIEMKMIRKMGILAGLILFFSIMIASSSLLIVEMKTGWKFFSSAKISPLSLLLTYFFGFHGVITTKVVDEMLTRYSDV